MLEHYTPEAVARILETAAEAGAKAAAKVVEAGVPVGRTPGRSPLYRRLGLNHGALRGSTRAARFRDRSLPGFVIGPIGRAAFTRSWVDQGNRHQRGQHYIDRTGRRALLEAEHASDRVLTSYATTK